MNESKKHGGARTGAGRKSLGRIFPKNFKFSETELKKIQENAKNEGVSVNEFIVRRCCD